MKKQYLFILLVVGLLTLFASCDKKAHYKALIITGQNNHNWKASSPVLKQILDETGMFTSEIMITPEKGGDMTTFNPQNMIWLCSTIMNRFPGVTMVINGLQRPILPF
jgi:hypothetical protein